MRYAIPALLLAVALTLAACAQPGPMEPNNSTGGEVNGSGDGSQAPILMVRHYGAFTLPEYAVSDFSVGPMGELILQTYTADNDAEPTATVTGTLTADELAQLKAMLESIESLEPRYGDGTGLVMDAGSANLTLWNGEEALRTTVDPNIPDAYPAQLQELKAWIDEKSGALWEQVHRSGDGTGLQAPLLMVRYYGGFTPEEEAQLSFIVDAQGMVTMTAMDREGSETWSIGDELTADELADLQELLAGVGSLEPRYGEELENLVMDAGSADYTILAGEESVQTTVNPNIADAYPAQLELVHQWVNARIQEMRENDRESRVSCSDPRPEACTKEYMPVCGDDGQEYGNGCTACANPDVGSYLPGLCPAGEEPGNESLA